MNSTNITGRPLAGKLRYCEDEHGWALDAGSFLAAWATSVTALMSCGTDEARLSFIKYARLYASNVVRRLSSADLVLDPKMFEPRDFQQMRNIVDDVSETIRYAKSTAHCGFLLLGMASTYVSLASRPGVSKSYQSRVSNYAKASIQRLQEISQSSSKGDAETILAELSRLEGNIDSVRRALQACSKAEPRIPSKELHDHKLESVLVETELPQLLQQAAIQ